MCSRSAALPKCSSSATATKQDSLASDNTDSLRALLPVSYATSEHQFSARGIVCGFFPQPGSLARVDHRQPNQALTEEHYRRLVERSPDGICVHRDGRILYVNDAGVRLMLADSPEAIIGRPVTDFVSPESIPPMQAGVAMLRGVGDCSPHFPAQMIRTDGTLLPVEIVIVLTIWDDELAHQVITRDVSSRHASDVALRYQAALVNHVSDAIIATTRAGVVTSWNPAAEAIYGRSADEAHGQPISSAVGA